MSTLVVKVCEVCGSQSVTGDGWLVISNIDIRSANRDEPVVQSDAPIDVCSPGCLLRYVSKSLEPAMHHQSRQAGQVHSPVIITKAA